MVGDDGRVWQIGLRAAFCAAVGLTAANCAGPGATTSSGRHPSELKYGVASSPRVIPEGEPIPKGGGRDMVGKPYVVAGRTYNPHPGKGYAREGWASWYGSAFHGRLTANGEVFDRESIAAAHPTLPLPSYVRVTNLVNHRSMIVRVNDRGPYEQGRLIDLSEKAADALGFHRKGTSRVRVQYVGRAALSGSDDAKLLASLRDDGLPARIDMHEPRPTMVANRTDDEPGKRDRTPIRVAAAARAEPGPVRAVPLPPTASRPALERQRPQSSRAIVAAADDERPLPLDIRPPRRPDLGGIY